MVISSSSWDLVRIWGTPMTGQGGGEGVLRAWATPAHLSPQAVPSVL